jgi:hypothetical protein
VQEHAARVVLEHEVGEGPAHVDRQSHQASV